MKKSELPSCVQWVEAKSPEALARALADWVAKRLERACAQRDRAGLAVSGGRTPVPFFEALSQVMLPWDRVDVTLVDERWVGAGHEASNTRLVMTHLLRGKAADARFIPVKTPEPSADVALDSVEANLETLTWPLDVAVLGMGNDGHTASLFPGAPGLAAALEPSGVARVAAITPPDAPWERITLTASALLSAQYRVLHLVGADKLATLDRALADIQDVAAMPIRLFLQHPLTIFWCP